MFLSFCLFVCLIFLYFVFFLIFVTLCFTDKKSSPIKFCPCLTLSSGSMVFVNFDPKYFRYPIPNGYKDFGVTNLLNRSNPNPNTFVFNVSLSKWLKINGFKTINGFNRYHRNVLEWSIGKECVSMVQFLLNVKNFSNIINIINTFDKTGYLPAHYVCDQKETSHLFAIFKLLVDFPITNLNIFDKKRGYLPIHYICIHNNVSMLEYLIQNYGRSRNSM